jgi:antitoxin component HigA of HigAB toxin-antitoxin module
MSDDLARGERLQIMLTKEEVEALDNWRFNKRMPSRAAAVRELLKRGLAAEGFKLAEIGSKSVDFGVTGSSSASPTRDRGEDISQAK